MPAGHRSVCRVALRKESVDRNMRFNAMNMTERNVALRKESVDRNPNRLKRPHRIQVALRKESVDRHAN